MLTFVFLIILLVLCGPTIQDKPVRSVNVERSLAMTAKVFAILAIIESSLSFIKMVFSVSIGSLVLFGIKKELTMQLYILLMFGILYNVLLLILPVLFLTKDYKKPRFRNLFIIYSWILLGFMFLMTIAISYKSKYLIMNNNKNNVFKANTRKKTGSKRLKNKKTG